MIQEKDKSKIVGAYSLPGLKNGYKFPLTNRGDDFTTFVLNLVCECFQQDVKRVLGKSRERPLVYCRHVAMYLVRKYTNLGINKIGVMFSRDHTSIMYATTHIQDLMETDDKMREIIRAIELKVQGAELPSP